MVIIPIIPSMPPLSPNTPLFLHNYSCNYRRACVIMNPNINGGLLKMGQFIYILLAAVVVGAVLAVTGSLKKKVDENMTIIDEMEHKYKDKTLK